MHHNPWSSAGFKIQIVCLILAPTLISAGIYLTLKHIALAVGPHLSRLNPRLYTWLFIPFDIFCLVLQGVGGGVDASAEVHPDLLKTGNNIIIAGIVLQVVILSIFGLLSLDFFWRAHKYHAKAAGVDGESESESEQAKVWRDKKFRMFVIAVSAAYFGILVRCVYRFVSFPLFCLVMFMGYAYSRFCIECGKLTSFNSIAEMAGGWGNPVMQNENLFYGLEGVYVPLYFIFTQLVQLNSKNKTNFPQNGPLPRHAPLRIRTRQLLSADEQVALRL